MHVKEYLRRSHHQNTQLYIFKMMRIRIQQNPAMAVSKGKSRVSKHTCRAESEGLSYKSSGVDIEAGNELVKRIQKLNPNIGGFSGMVPFGASELCSVLRLLFLSDMLYFFIR